MNGVSFDFDEQVRVDEGLDLYEIAGPHGSAISDSRFPGCSGIGSLCRHKWTLHHLIGSCEFHFVGEEIAVVINESQMSVKSKRARIGGRHFQSEC
jgi:hypothetical protein